MSPHKTVAADAVVFVECLTGCAYVGLTALFLAGSTHTGRAGRAPAYWPEGRLAQGR